MIIQRKANEQISSIVDVIWYVDEENLEDARRSDTIVPSGHIHIVYNFADPYYLIDGSDQILVPDAILVGQFDDAFNIRYGTHVKQLGIAFHPSALYALYKEVSGIYTGAVIDISKMESMNQLNKEIHKIIDAIREPDRIIDAIESFFEKYRYDDVDIRLFEQMMHYIQKYKGIIDVKLMASEFGYSVSSLERNFKKHMGLTPKAYANIIRFRYSVLEDDPQKLFYDQSHFIRNCRKYTNKIPAELSKSEEISLRNILQI